MALVAGVGVPTRTDLLNWDHTHLTAAATAWWNLADAWEDAFYTICKEVHNPAGAQWTGYSAQAASLGETAPNGGLGPDGSAQYLHDLYAAGLANDFLVKGSGVPRLAKGVLP